LFRVEINSDLLGQLLEALAHGWDAAAAGESSCRQRASERMSGPCFITAMAAAR
jgi:hypothetical protein